MFKIFVVFLKNLKLLSSVAIRLTKITGKAKETIHPKHLIKAEPWFLKFLSKSDVVLDIGCGNGQNVMKSAKYVKKIIGLDLDLKELEKGKREAKRKKIKNLEFYQSSAEEKLKFKNESFDKVLFFDVLEHLENQDLSLSEIWRVLKKGGFLFVSVPNKNTSWKKLQRSFGLNYFSDPDHKREYSKNEIKKLLGKRQFKITEVSPIVYDTPFAPAFDLIGGFSLLAYAKLLKWKRKRAIKNPSESTGFEIIAEKR